VHSHSRVIFSKGVGSPLLLPRQRWQSLARFFSIPSRLFLSFFSLPGNPLPPPKTLSSSFFERDIFSCLFLPHFNPQNESSYSCPPLRRCFPFFFLSRHFALPHACFPARADFSLPDVRVRSFSATLTSPCSDARHVSPSSVFQFFSDLRDPPLLNVPLILASASPRRGPDSPILFCYAGKRSGPIGLSFENRVSLLTPSPRGPPAAYIASHA